MNSHGLKNSSFYRRRRFWFYVLIIILLFAIILHYYELNEARKHKGNPLPVVLAKAAISTVPVYVTALGSVTPTYSVTVKTQVNGTLMQVLFHEGQLVKTGDVLAQIDPRPLEAQVLEFEGQLARDQAELANAKIDLVRYKTLYKQDSVSQQTLATQAALVKQLIGTVQLDQGQLNAAQVNLGYCRIISPINGRVGLRLVDPGNFVQTSDTTGIAVVNTINPITVIFSIPEDDVPQVAQQIYEGVKLPVKAYDRDQNQLLATGTIITIDNQIDPTTGTVKLRALFPNKDNALFPSQFVNIDLLAKTLKNATIIPTAAVQPGANGNFVYVCNKNKTVTVTPVTVGVTIGDYTTISKGISPGELVVTDGADKLSDGASVAVFNNNSHDNSAANST